MDARGPQDSLTRSREDSLGRLKALSDGTVAIALTLLVLPLVDVAKEDGDESVLTLLRDNSLTFLAFAISFIVIARLWSAHRRYFALLRDFDTGVVARLLGWLFTIVWLPFPTDLLFSRNSLRSGSATLYLISLLAASAAGAWQLAYLHGRPELLHAFVTPAMLREARRQGSLVLVVITVCTVASVVQPEVGLLGLFLLGLTDRVSLPGPLRRQPDAALLPD